MPVVSIVGYTNAGKSTLLNALTGGEVRAADQLFVTLDPTSRRLRFPREREVVITDTVGFIADLPHDLVAAFRATLEELADADLLLHVVDAADPALERKLEAVEALLDELGLADIPRLLVLNKADLLAPEAVRGLEERFVGVSMSQLVMFMCCYWSVHARSISRADRTPFWRTSLAVALGRVMGVDHHRNRPGAQGDAELFGGVWPTCARRSAFIGFNSWCCPRRRAARARAVVVT